jgi:hypothetical protein
VDASKQEGPLYIVGIREAAKEFVDEIRGTPSPTISLDDREVWLDTVLETMVSHFEYRATAVDSYRDFLFSERIDFNAENERIERAADLESLLEFGKKIFAQFEQTGMYSHTGTLAGKYLRVHGDHAVVLCHSLDTGLGDDHEHH